MNGDEKDAIVQGGMFEEYDYFSVDNIRPVRWWDEKDVVIREQPGLKKVDHNITYEDMEMTSVKEV